MIKKLDEKTQLQQKKHRVQKKSIAGSISISC